MTFYLAGLNAFVLFGFIFGFIAVVSVAALLVVHRFLFPIARLLQGERFLVPFFTINGAVLGFLLAMVLVETWKNYQGEKENITSEVSNYINIYRSTRGFDSVDCVQAQEYVREIVKSTIEKSWPEMEKGGDGMVVSKTLDDFQLFILKLKSEKPEHTDLRKLMLDNLNKASELRRNRLLKASENVVPEPLWIVIFCCIFISIFSGFVFAIKPMYIHIILTLFQCIMISFVLFLMIAFMYPYRGPMKIGPGAFERLLIKSFPRVSNKKFIQIIPYISRYVVQS